MPGQHKRGLQNMTGAQAPGRPGYAAIVLAAGAGRRFGGGKLLAAWQGRPLVEGALDAALASGSDPILVVTGADAGPVAEAVRDWGRDREAGARLKILHAEDHAEGMGASLRTGASALPTGLEGVFVFLGDMPGIPHDIFDGLIGALAAGAPAAAPEHQGRRGHPVLFCATLIPELARASGDAGARDALLFLGDRLVRIPTDSPGVLFDVDRPGDLDSAPVPEVPR
jgi:molybdenum cofactor cytidylyltransferase